MIKKTIMPLSDQILRDRESYCQFTDPLEVTETLGLLPPPCPFCTQRILKNMEREVH